MSTRGAVPNNKKTSSDFVLMNKILQMVVLLAKARSVRNIMGEAPKLN